MTVEDAKYYSIMLGVGEFEEFNIYIQNLINSNDEIDDLEADLIFESNNFSKCCDILTNYYSNKSVDDALVAFKLILFIKNNITSNKLTRDDAIILLVKYSKEANKLAEDKLVEPWVTMKLLGLLLDPSNTIIVDSDFDNFINNGKTLTGDIEFEGKYQRFLKK